LWRLAGDPRCPPAHLLTFSPVHLFTWAHTLSHTNCFLSQPPSEMSALKGQRPCVLFGIYLRLQAAKVEKRARNIYHTYIPYICDIRGMLLTKVIHPNTYIFTAAYISLGICNSSFPRIYSWANRYDYMTIWPEGQAHVLWVKASFSAFTCK